MRMAAATLAAAMVLSAAAPARAEPVRLADYLANPKHDALVRKEVLAWHGTMTNGCVAYVSTALRHVGVAVPQDGKLDGEGISRITRAFAVYLQQALGYWRVSRLADLRPGDLVFTVDVSCCPGYPAHVFVFLGWSSRRRAVALVVDNQGTRHERPLRTRPGSPIDAFAYALRAPR
jgi:hypothetical protein